MTNSATSKLEISIYNPCWRSSKEPVQIKIWPLLGVSEGGETWSFIIAFPKFPWVLDMEPYTAEGMLRREDATENVESSSSESESGESSVQTEETILDEEVPFAMESDCKQINYELVGVVVHSGQANAGHYYSFIKDRR